MKEWDLSRGLLCLGRGRVRGLHECEALGAVGEVDDAAIGEMVTAQCGKHGEVGAVGVDAHGVGDAEGMGKDLGHDTMYMGEGGDPVDDIVGTIVEPLAIIDDGVGWVRAWNKCEGCHGDAALHEQIAVAAVDVGCHLLLGGVTVCPLREVALGYHLPAALSDEVHDGGEVGGGGRS